MLEKNYCKLRPVAILAPIIIYLFTFGNAFADVIHSDEAASIISRGNLIHTTTNGSSFVSLIELRGEIYICTISQNPGYSPSMYCRKAR